MSSERRVQIDSARWIGAPDPPRAWQADALDVALGALADGKRGVIRAVMGAGKSRLMAEVVASVYPERHGVIVVTAPTRALVEQLHATLAARMLSVTARPAERLGRWYSEVKELRPITVACHNSLPTLLEAIEGAGRHVSLWIADEAHRTNASWCLEFYTNVCERWGEPLGLGFSATPYLADGRDRLALWEAELYAYGWREALDSGVLVPWEVRHYTGEDAPLNEVAIRMIRDHLKRHPGQPGLANAASVLDAEDCAGQLRAVGVRAEAVHSQTARGHTADATARLLAGRLDCLVHVNMLAEGVDIPPLRWLMMRRPVGSRVRFAQEVGRVLRASPGKDRAIIFDPLDLFGQLRLSYGAALSNGVDPDDLRARIEDLNELDEHDVADAFAQIQGELELRDEDAPTEPAGWAALMRQRGLWANVLAPTRGYLRRLQTATSALYPRDDVITSQQWRLNPPSDRQLAYATSLAGLVFGEGKVARSIPARHRRILKLALSNLPEWDAGMVSDVIDCLTTIRQHGWSARIEQMTSGMGGGEEVED